MKINPKLILFVFLFGMLNTFIHATEMPTIWHRPDSLMVLPQSDAIEWTDSYTIFSVVRSLQPNTNQCLWGFLEKVLQYAVNRVIIKILNKNGGSINGKKVDFIDYGM